MRLNALLFSLALMSLAAAPARSQAPATRYILSPDFPKYATAHVEVRDSSGDRWPNFFYGKPATNGTIDVNSANPAASFVLNCNQRPQKQGDQSRRVLGEVFPAQSKGGVIVAVTAIAGLTEMKGKERTWQGTFTGNLNVEGRQVPFDKAPGSLRMNAAGRGQEKNEALLFDFAFEAKAAAFGLKTMASEAPLKVRVAATAYAPAAGELRKPGSK